MREFKFRYIFEDIKEDGRTLVTQIWNLNDIEINDIVYNTEVLIARNQYTGLKDKNGVEIYEGDIVVYDDTPYNAHTSVLTGIIKMENLSFKLMSIKPDSLGYRKMLIGNDDFFNVKSKVIGNLYEK